MTWAANPANPDLFVEVSQMEFLSEQESDIQKTIKILPACDGLLTRPEFVILFFQISAQQNGRKNHQRQGDSQSYCSELKAHE
jgi:hypothetical protein